MAAINRSPSIRGLDDIITEDGILCLIISLLPLREAARTSVLSRRWRYLWTHIPKLVFDDVNIFDAQSLLGHEENRLVSKQELYEVEMERANKFIQSVNSVLEHRQGLGRLDHFELAYFLHESHTEHLDKWVQYAVASGTRVLRFYLTSGGFCVDLYYFPFQLLESSTIEVLDIGCCTLYPAHKFDGLNHLKKLTLYDVAATDVDINHLLCNSPSLKTMLMFKSDLKSLCIPHPVSELEILIVSGCSYMSEIEMNAEKLLLLEYKGVPVDFKFKQSSQLYDAVIYFKIWDLQNLNFLLTGLASNLPHLRCLNFKISGVLPEVTELPEVSSNFAHLKNLNFAWKVGDEMSLLHLATILNTAPLLQVLTLHFARATEEPSEKLSNLEEILSMRMRACTHLKTIKITGFYFDQWQVDIVIHLLNIATELESMTIEKGGDISVEKTDIQNLWQQVPANIKFVIL